MSLKNKLTLRTLRTLRTLGTLEHFERTLEPVQMSFVVAGAQTSLR